MSMNHRGEVNSKCAVMCPERLSRASLMLLTGMQNAALMSPSGQSNIIKISDTTQPLFHSPFLACPGHPATKN
jgi:hypothetical protein